MASSLEFVQFVVEQIGKEELLYKKMFGEYGLWYQGKFFGTIEEDRFYVKITEAGRKMLPDAQPVAPHGGNPGMLCVEELEDREWLRRLVEETCRELPLPKPRKKKIRSPYL